MAWVALGKIALKAVAKQGAKQAVKGSIKGAAKGAVKKKLSAKNIKSNLLKKRQKLKKVQLERQKQEETVSKPSNQPQDSGKGRGKVGLAGLDLGIFGKIINVISIFIWSYVIRKIIQFREGIGKTISAIKPIWDVVMGTLAKMAGGIMFIFKAAGAVMGLGKKNRELEQAKNSIKQSNEGINNELAKQEYSGEEDKDEEQEEKKETDQKDAVISKALKESTDFIESEATVNQVDDKQMSQSQGDTNPATMVGKVNKIVKGKADASTSKLNNTKAEVSPAVQRALDKVNANELGGFKTVKNINDGLGPTQNQKNKGKMVIQPVERIVRVGGGNGSSGGSGSSNIKSPVPSSSNAIGLP